MDVIDYLKRVHKFLYNKSFIRNYRAKFLKIMKLWWEILYESKELKSFLSFLDKKMTFKDSRSLSLAQDRNISPLIWDFTFPGIIGMR